MQELSRAMDLMREQRFGEAEVALRALLAAEPGNAHAWFAAGIAAYQLGALPAAEERLRRTLALNERYLPAYNNLALVLKALGRPLDSIALLERALALEPAYAEAAYNLALCCEAAGHAARAAGIYRQLIAAEPGFLPAQANLGNILRAQGAPAEAEPHLRIVAERLPGDADAQLNLALALSDAGRYADALAFASRASTLAPGDPRAWEALGNAQRLAGRTGDAVDALRRAVALRPDDADLAFDLGTAELADGRLEDGDRTLAALLAARPDRLDARFERELALPPVYRSEAQIAECRERFARGLDAIATELDAAPVDAALDAVSTFAPFYLGYQNVDNTALQKRFGSIVDAVARRAFPEFAEPLPRAGFDGSRRLRVGFASAYLRRHSVGYFFGAWITGLDRTRFEVHVFDSGEIADELTARLARGADAYARISALRPLAERIKASRLDVLVHLDVGIHPQAQVLAALRLAPVQCAAYGHPVTTGIGNVDAFLSAGAAEPVGAAAHYTERLLRLPGMGVSYPRPTAKPAATTGRARRLVCAQRLPKVLPHFDRLAARIARALGDHTFAFFTASSRQLDGTFVERLRAAGVPAGRIEMLPVMPYAEFLGTVAAADAVLDTTFFSGGTTSYDVFATGTPIVAYQGPMMRGRQTAAMLSIMGVDELVAHDDDTYVANAVALATDAARRTELRARIANGSARLFDDRSAVREFEQALLGLV